MPKATPSRIKKSKAELEKEFSKVADEASELKQSASSKTEELSRLRETEIRQQVEGVSVEGVVQQLWSLGLEISKALASISGNSSPRWSN